MRARSGSGSVILLLLAVGLLARCQAVSYTAVTTFPASEWVDWTNSSLWSPPGVPGKNDDVTISSAKNQIRISTVVDVGSLSLVSAQDLNLRIDPIASLVAGGVDLTGGVTGGWLRIWSVFRWTHGNLIGYTTNTTIMPGAIAFWPYVSSSPTRLIGAGHRVVNYGSITSGHDSNQESIIALGQAAQFHNRGLFQCEIACVFLASPDFYDRATAVVNSHGGNLTLLGGAAHMLRFKVPLYSHTHGNFEIGTGGILEFNSGGNFTDGTIMVGPTALMTVKSLAWDFVLPYSANSSSPGSLGSILVSSNGLINWQLGGSYDPLGWSCSHQLGVRVGHNSGSSTQFFTSVDGADRCLQVADLFTQQNEAYTWVQAHSTLVSESWTASDGTLRGAGTAVILGAADNPAYATVQDLTVVLGPRSRMTHRNVINCANSNWEVYGEWVVTKDDSQIYGSLSTGLMRFNVGSMLRKLRDSGGVTAWWNPIETRGTVYLNGTIEFRRSISNYGLWIVDTGGVAACAGYDYSLPPAWLNYPGSQLRNAGQLQIKEGGGAGIGGSYACAFEYDVSNGTVVYDQPAGLGLAAAFNPTAQAGAPIGLWSAVSSCVDLGAVMIQSRGQPWDTTPTNTFRLYHSGGQLVNVCMRSSSNSALNGGYALLGHWGIVTVEASVTLYITRMWWDMIEFTGAGKVVLGSQTDMSYTPDFVGLEGGNGFPFTLQISPIPAQLESTKVCMKRLGGTVTLVNTGTLVHSARYFWARTGGITVWNFGSWSVSDDWGYLTPDGIRPVFKNWGAFSAAASSSSTTSALPSTQSVGVVAGGSGGIALQRLSSRARRATGASARAGAGASAEDTSAFAAGASSAEPAAAAVASAPPVPAARASFKALAPTGVAVPRRLSLLAGETATPTSPAVPLVPHDDSPLLAARASSSAHGARPDAGTPNPQDRLLASTPTPPLVLTPLTGPAPSPSAPPAADAASSSAALPLPVSTSASVAGSLLAAGPVSASTSASSDPASSSPPVSS